MSPTDLGQKHECEECGAKFYDLGKTKPACPSCGHVEGQAPAPDSEEE